MASLQAIRDAIKATLTSLEDLTAYDTVPEVANLPAVVVMPADADFDRAFGRGTDTWTFDLAVMVSWGDSDVAQDQLDAYVTGAGPQSIRQKIFENRDLGLINNADAHVSRMTGYGSRFNMAQVEHIGAKLRLIVHTRGTA